MMVLKMPEYERAFHLVGADKIIPWHFHRQQ
jgi:hypothetical protein